MLLTVQRDRCCTFGPAEVGCQVACVQLWALKDCGLNLYCYMSPLQPGRWSADGWTVGWVL